MRAVVFACVILLAAAASAADAEEPPLQKAGEWQIVQLGDHGVGADYVATECVGDRSILAKFDAMPNCSRKEIHTDATITTADAQCRVLDSAVSYHEKIMQRSDDDFYIYMHVTYAPPAFRGTELENAETILFTHLKRLGPCPAGKRPRQ